MMNANKCIDLLRMYLLGENYYIVDPVGGDQANTIITHDILTKFSKRYRKERRNIIDEDFIRSKTAVIFFECPVCDKIHSRNVVLTENLYRESMHKIVETLVYRYDRSLCSDCFVSASTNSPMRIIGIKYRGHYMARPCKITTTRGVDTCGKDN